MKRILILLLLTLCFHANSQQKYTIEQVNEFEKFTGFKEAFLKAEEVKALSLRGQSLTELPPGMSKLTSLVYLDLGNNQFTDIPAVLDRIPGLQYLKMDSCAIKKVKRDLSRLSELSYLDLSSNMLSTVPASVFKIPGLTHLHLNNNWIRSLPNPKKTPYAQSRLVFLSLMNNNLSQIPEQLSFLNDLAELDISHNNIRKITEDIIGLKQLTLLSLMHNPIKSIDPNFFELRELQNLSILSSRFSSLPAKVSNFEKLETLLIGHMRLPESFKELNLRKLAFLGSSYSTLPDVVYSQKNLEFLFLSGNEWNDETLVKIAGFKKLETLHLARAGLEVLPESIFQLPNLKEVNLSGNEISNVPTKMGDLAHLKELNLTDSPLKGRAILSLKKALPRTSLVYFDTDMSQNFRSLPIQDDFLMNYYQMMGACEAGDANACFELGNFFESNADYGLAEKVYKKVSESAAMRGTAESMVCKLRIADMYDDIDGEKAFISDFKRRKYTDWDDYVKTYESNKALKLYIDICKSQAHDKAGQDIQKKAAGLVYKMYENIIANLENIYSENGREIERLIEGVGNMEGVSAAGDMVLNSATETGGAVVGAIGSLFGKVAADSKESKIAKVKADNQALETEILRLKNLANSYMSK